MLKSDTLRRPEMDREINETVTEQCSLTTAEVEDIRKRLAFLEYKVAILTRENRELRCEAGRAGGRIS